jgi:hypothetical protein
MEGGDADAGEPGPRVRIEPVSGCSPVSGAVAGQIVMVGHDPRKLRTIVVERWTGSAAESAIMELPRPRAHEDIDLCALAVGAGEAWVYGVGRIPYLARFDGKSWTREDPPGDERIAFMVAGDDGTVLLGFEKAVYRRVSGVWQQLDVPEHQASFSSAAVVAGQIWVSTGSELFGPETPYAPMENMYFTAENDGALERAPLTPMCTTPYVVLQKKVPPAKKEFPDVAAKVKDAIALDGVELVTEFNAKFTDLGARVPSYAAATALAKKAEGNAYCHAPQVVKTIPLSP